MRMGLRVRRPQFRVGAVSNVLKPIISRRVSPIEANPSWPAIIGGNQPAHSDPPKTNTTFSLRRPPPIIRPPETTTPVTGSPFRPAWRRRRRLRRLRRRGRPAPAFLAGQIRVISGRRRFHASLRPNGRSSIVGRFHGRILIG